MGWAECRFKEETGCIETGSYHWHVYLSEDIMINVPSMWKHYMTDHLVQPTERERDVVMAADPSKASGELIRTYGASKKLEEVKVMYVEKTGPGEYTHKVGTEPDTEFIEKLEEILDGIDPLQTLNG